MFIPGSEYRRAEIHLQYGEQTQGGISTPRGHKLIFLFSSLNGSLYGYRDGWTPDGSYYFQDNVPDVEGHARRAIIFRLVPA
jgi:5-methylcytosine-specific restriction protein A